MDTKALDDLLEAALALRRVRSPGVSFTAEQLATEIAAFPAAGGERPNGGKIEFLLHRRWGRGIERDTDVSGWRFGRGQPPRSREIHSHGQVQ